MADLKVAADQLLESTQEGEESQAPTQSEDDVATWKRRLTGKDQALTAAKKAADEFRTKYEELAEWKALQEESSLSEFEKAARKIRQLEDELNNTKTQYETEKLKVNYPRYYEFQEKVRSLGEAERAAEFENFVKQFTGDQQATETPGDVNTPKRNVPKDKTMDTEAILVALKAMGNPWQE